MNVIGEQQAGLFLYRVPGQQPKTGTKEGKQAQLSPVTPQQNTHIEDPLSLYDDGVSDEEGRYIKYFSQYLHKFNIESSQIFPELLHS